MTTVSVTNLTKCVAVAAIGLLVLLCPTTMYAPPPNTKPATDSGVPNGMKEFKNSGTFIVPNGVTRLLVEVWSAGGGGGASVLCIGGPEIFGGNGGAGAYSRAVINVASGDNVSVVIGQGGSPGASGGPSSVATGTSIITSGGGQGGGNANIDCCPFVCDGSGAQGAPGTPDPNASIGRTYPASGTIEPTASFGGASGFPAGFAGGDGYVLIQW